MKFHRLTLAFVLHIFACFGWAHAASITVSLDRWMYPFAFNGGTRDLAPTFGAVGSEGFDNRDGQFIFGFDTSGEIAMGQGAARYQISSLTVQAMVGSPSGFVYDPTYDSFRTYLEGDDPEYMADADAGRPIELHGIGFRNGYTQLSFGATDNQPPEFEESAPFGPVGARTRNVFPLGFLAPRVGSDVSNNIDDRMESDPWAVGITDLTPGEAVKSNTALSFNIDLSNAGVLDYLQQGLDRGVLGFAITSIHEAAQTGGPPVPQFVTKENSRAGSVAAVLEIDYQILPESPAARVWGIDADGLASVGANWSGGTAPTAAGDSAAFLDAITTNRTVQIDVPLSLAQLRFDNGFNYTLGGPQTIVLAAPGEEDATLLVDNQNGNGQHSLGGELIVGDALSVVQHSEQPLVLSGPLDNTAGHTITKTGAGTLVITGVQSQGPGASLVIEEGAVIMNSDAGTPEARNLTISSNGTLTLGSTQHLAGLSIGSGGKAQLAAGNTGTLVTCDLSIAGEGAPAGQLDIADNSLVLDYRPAEPNPAAAIRQQIVAGRGATGLGAKWTGDGITSSAAAVAVATEPESVTVAYAVNGDLPLGPYGTFHGETVDASSLLVRYTRTGDANLDGVVNDDDVTIVGANYAPGVPQPHWAWGDFDYNGFVDDDDVTLLGVFYDPSAAPLTGSAPANVSAVPEPSTVYLAIFTMAAAAAWWCKRVSDVVN